MKETATVEQYAAIFPIANTIPDDMLDVLRMAALGGWTAKVRNAGYQPMREPTVVLDYAVTPRSHEYREPRRFGIWPLRRRIRIIDEPTRQWRVVGPVLPDWIPTPIGGWPADDTLTVNLPHRDTPNVD